MPTSRKKQQPNPLNDEDYTTNDPQIEDLKELVLDLHSALSDCIQQMEQMQGMFDDDDGQIAAALKEANTAYGKVRTV